MKSLTLALLAPLIAALPSPHTKADDPSHAGARALPELSTSQWADIQSGFSAAGGYAKSLGEWSWHAAQELVHDKAYEHPPFASVSFDGDETQKTIWQRLKDDPDEFSRLTKLVEFVGGKPKEILDDKDLQITFFAPNNDALQPPEHHHEHDHDAALASLAEDPSLASLSAHYERYFAADDDDKDTDKKRKEIFKFIAAKVLAYHGLPKAYTATELAQNSTFETGLKAEDGSYAGLHRRVRIEKTLLPPSLKVNFYARVVSADKKASNGVYHTINHPLIPPGSIFESLYVFPDFFSTVTSAIQGSDGRHYLDWAYDREHSEPGKPKFHGSPVATFFSPTNAAFALLPPRLKFFLFSPFGERALKRVLAYHYVPHSILLSEFQYHEKHDHHKEHAEQVSVVDDNDPSFHRELEVPTGLPNATLKVVIEKSKVVPIEGAVKTTIKVNGQQVQTIDVPSRNGAFHVLGKLLVPPHHDHHHGGGHKEDVNGQDSWENWEEWLPAWAALE